jgi:hypothetical protein
MDEVDPAQVMLDEIASLEAERAQIEARIAARALDFADVRRQQIDAEPNPQIARLERSAIADQLAVVLHQPTRTVQVRLAQARRARSLMPRTWLAFRAGLVDAYRLSLIASTAGALRHAASIAELDDDIARFASTRTAAQLKAKLRRFVATREPSGESAKDELKKRHVRVEHSDDGMSYLSAYLPTRDAVRIDHLLTAEARKKAADDPRTLDQARCDAFRRLLLGDPAERTGGNGVVIGVTVPVTTLAGLSDAPGESFDGEFALPADLVRRMAAEPGTLFHRLLTDPLGHVLDVTETGRFPSAKLRIAVAARDGTCSFPSCSARAFDCDLDHQTPHPRGPTSGDNLKPLCRRHHNFKTFGILDPYADTMSPHRSRFESRLKRVVFQYAAV